MRPIEDGVRIQEDVTKLTRWDDTLLWYAKAVASLRAKPLTDPTSWRYQAAIHAYRRELDPLAVDGEALPSNADQSRFWGKCQHGGWYFLPWHRAYLACFEQIVRAEIVKLGGPDAWALPYWNYSDPDDPHALLVRPNDACEQCSASFRPISAHGSAPASSSWVCCWSRGRTSFRLPDWGFRWGARRCSAAYACSARNAQALPPATVLAPSRRRRGP
jgi:hypothetical protein